MSKPLKYLIGSIVGLAAVLVLLYAGYCVHNYTTAERYDYDNFSPSQYQYGEWVGPKPGQMAADFIAMDIDGKEVRLSDYLGKTVVVETGSITCPMYVGRVPGMNTLVPEFPDVVFVVLYVREAHPGTKYPQPHSTSEKLSHARDVVTMERELRKIWIDDVNGTAHQAYRSWPNMAYVIDGRGIVRYRQRWSDPEMMRTALTRITLDQPTDDLVSRMIPPAPGVSMRVLSRAGIAAFLDLAVTLPHVLLGHLTEYIKEAESVASKQ